MFDSIKEGDRVRVTFEAAFEKIDSDGDAKLYVGDSNGGMNVWVPEGAFESVEVVTPPVITFGAGDLVKNRESGNRYLITGITQDGKTPYYSFQFMETSFTHTGFTSDWYEKLEVPA